VSLREAASTSLTAAGTVSTGSKASAGLRRFSVVSFEVGMNPRQGFPRIGFQVLHGQAEAALFLVDGHYDAFHPVALLQDFGRVVDLLGPRHLGDVDEAFHALVQFHEHAVVGYGHDLASILFLCN
jgi:hypothetical protein